MQIQSIVIAALAAVAVAMPGQEGDYDRGHGGDHGKECKPIAYECTQSHGKPGWNVCNTSNKWEVSAFPLNLFYTPSLLAPAVCHPYGLEAQGGRKEEKEIGD